MSTPSPSPEAEARRAWAQILAELHRLVESLVRHPTRNRDRLYAFCVPPGGEPVFYPERPDQDGMDVFAPLMESARAFLAGAAEQQETIDERVANASRLMTVPREDGWLGQLAGPELPFGDSTCVMGWFGYLPDIFIGLTVEWTWHCRSHNPLFSDEGVLPDSVRAFRGALGLDAHLPAGISVFTTPPEFVRERAATVAGSAIDSSIRNGIGRDIGDRLAATTQPLSSIVDRFRRLSQLTMEKAGVTGAMIMTIRSPMTEDVCYRARRFLRFEQPVSFTGCGIRHLLKLFSLSNGTTTFLLAEWDQILGIVDFPTPARYWDEPLLLDRAERANLPKGNDAFLRYLESGNTVTNAQSPLLRITGPGRGAIYFGSRRLIDLREGEFRYDSAVGPVVAARTAMRRAGAGVELRDSVQRTVAILRSRRKGAMFIILGPGARPGPAIGRSRIDAELLTVRDHSSHIAPVSDLASAELLADVASLDGAVVLDIGGRLRSLGAIVAPPANPLESLDFGARHNTAIRITSSIPGTTVIVVSEDGFVTSWRQGRQIDPDVADMGEIMTGESAEVLARPGQ